MRILIVNRFAPPDDAPTAILAGELAQQLRDEGHEVIVIAQTGLEYRRGPKRGLPRALNEVRCHATLFCKMLGARRGDLLLCLSSPACLPVTAALAAALKRMRFGHWAMDVYPEVAAALGEIRSDGVVFRACARLMRWAYRRAHLLVALDADMQEVLQKKGTPAEICPPWPPAHLHAMWPASDPGTASRQRFTWLYSGNLGRAHEWKCLLDAQAALERMPDKPRDVVLLFQGRGAAQAEAQDYARALGLQHCQWLDYVAREQLLDSLFAADVLIATQRPETMGLLWPSKLAVALHVPRPLLWIGPANGAVAEMLRPLPHAGIFTPDDSAAVAKWIRQRSEAPTLPLYERPEPEAQRAKGAARMAALIKSGLEDTGQRHPQFIDA